MIRYRIALRCLLIGFAFSSCSDKAVEPVKPTDTTTIPADTTTIPSDTTTIPADTTTIPSDTTTIPADTTTIPDALALFWSKNIGGSGNDAAEAVAVLPDGSIVFAGWTNSSGAGGTDVYFVKTDDSGKVIWEKTFGGPSNDAAYDMIVTADGDMVIAGTSGGYAYLIKTDADGNLIWDTTYSGGSSSLFAVAETNGGSLVAGGNSRYPGGGFPSAYLVKTDPSGTLDWERHYAGFNACPNWGEKPAGYGTDVIVSTEGHIFFVWNALSWYITGHTGCGPPTSHFCWTELDTAGTKVGAYSNAGSDWGSYPQAHAAILTTDGHIAILLTGESILVLSSNGTFVSELSLASLFTPEAFIVSYSGSYILAGQMGGDVSVATMNPQNNSTDVVTFGGDQSETATALAQTPDGHIIVAGWTYSFSESRDVYLAKISIPR